MLLTVPVRVVCVRCVRLRVVVVVVGGGGVVVVVVVDDVGGGGVLLLLLMLVLMLVLVVVCAPACRVQDHEAGQPPRPSDGLCEACAAGLLFVRRKQKKTQ